MFHQDQKQCVVVDYSLEKMFDAILNGAESLSGFSVKSSNRVTHSVSINVGLSLFSWGEQMTVSLKDLAEDKTEIVFFSGSKLGTVKWTLENGHLNFKGSLVYRQAN